MTVIEYVDKFEELASLIPEVPGTFPTKLQLFIMGLKLSLREDVIGKSPKTVAQAVASAIASKLEA